LYAVADEKKITSTFEVIEKALEKLSPIAQKFEVQPLPWPGVQQAFYKLADASEYLLIDLAVLEPDAPETFLAPEIHGNAVFLFNKNNRVKTPKLDTEAHIKKAQARLERLKARFSMFNIFVQKEINRGNTIEAMDLYHAFTFGSLVEALRIKYTPFHYDFKTRYVHHELPKHLVKKLEQLTFVRDAKELQVKYDEATRLFHETVQSIDIDKIGKVVRHQR
jgi:hypothetical protein